MERKTQSRKGELLKSSSWVSEESTTALPNSGSRTSLPFYLHAFCTTPVSNPISVTVSLSHSVQWVICRTKFLQLIVFVELSFAVETTQILRLKVFGLVILSMNPATTSSFHITAFRYLTLNIISMQRTIA